MGARRWWWWAVLATVLVVGVVIAVVAVRDDGDSTGATTTTTTESTTTTRPTTTTTTGPPASTTTTTVPVPGTPVATVTPGGGSGETSLSWSSASGAAGYRVLRGDDEDGPFTEVAVFDITTGEVTAVTGIVNLFSSEHTYLPRSGALTSPDGSSRFELVDVSPPAPRCYQVIAYNEFGEGEPSTAVCGSPP